MSQNQIGRIAAERDGHILKIKIDNAAKKNALTPEMLTQLSRALTELDDENSLFVGMIYPSGDHTCVGLDMTKFPTPDAIFATTPEGCVDPFGLKRRLRKPLLFAVTGMTYTCLIELMLAGDIVIADETASFCQMEAKRGFAPLAGGQFRYLSRMSWGDAMYHLLQCDTFDAGRAHKIGLVQEVVPAGRHVERALEVANKIARNAPLGLQATIEASRAMLSHGEKAAIDLIPETQKRLLASADAKEGVLSFIERREARFTGS